MLGSVWLVPAPNSPAWSGVQPRRNGSKIARAAAILPPPLGRGGEFIVVL